MQILFTTDVRPGAGLAFEAGQRYDLDPALANLYIAQGVATLSTDRDGLMPSSRFTDAQCDALESLVSGGGKFIPEVMPRAVITGNSISGNALWGGAAATQQGLASESEPAFAQRLAPLGYWRPTMTAIAEVAGTSGGVDASGNHGFSGKRCDEIITDWQATWFPALDANGIVPGLIYATCLFENDIGTGAPLATVQARARRAVDVLRQKFPGAIIHLGTSRADARLSNAAYAAVALAFADWLQTLENGIDIVVSNFWIGSYSDSATPSNAPAAYTDGAVHPNARGAAHNGRVIAASNQRFTRRIPRLPGNMRSANMVFAGSVAATGSGNSGTVPTAVSTPLPTAGTAVWATGNPGALRLTYSGATTAAAAMLTQTASLPSTDTAGYIKVHIVSGAENLQDVYCVYQLIGASTIKTADRRSSGVTSGDGGFRDGDELTLIAPHVAMPSTPTGVYVTLYVLPRATGQIVLDVIGMGHNDI